MQLFKTFDGNAVCLISYSPFASFLNTILIMHKTILLFLFFFFNLTAFCFGVVKFSIHYSAHPFLSVCAEAGTHDSKVFPFFLFFLFMNLKSLGANGYSRYIHPSL